MTDATTSPPATDYSLVELMCTQTARETAGAGVTFVGLGLPVLTTTLAKVHHDPALIFCTEVGVMDWDPPTSEVDHAPNGIADPILNRGAAYVGDMVDTLGSLLMGGRVDLAILGGAQVDRFGNLNALMIGDDRFRPETRFRGTGGNTDAACLAPRVLTVMSLEPRRFAERVSFLTSPGYISGPGGRAASGLDTQGPNLVVSTMGVFDFDTEDGGATGSCQLRLRKLFPGAKPEVIDDMLPWPLLVADDLETVAAPSEEELRVLRYLDPRRISLAEGRY
jgi:glutaconate CoA-transferase subunit B